MEVRKLEGYVTVPQAAGMLGMSKQGLHKLLFQHGDAGPFTEDDLVDVGGDKAMYLVQVSAVERVRELRATRAAEQEAYKAERASNPEAVPEQRVGR